MAPFSQRRTNSVCDYDNFLFENAASSVVVQETVVETYRSLIISNLSVSN